EKMFKQTGPLAAMQFLQNCLRKGILAFHSLNFTFILGNKTWTHRKIISVLRTLTEEPIFVRNSLSDFSLTTFSLIVPSGVWSLENTLICGWPNLFGKS